MGELCANLLSEFNNNEEQPNEYAINIAYTILATFSIICLCIVALSIFYNKQLGEHPSPLIANICIVEAIMSWNSLFSFIKPKYVICYFDAYLFFGPSSGHTYYEAFIILISAHVVS